MICLTIIGTCPDQVMVALGWSMQEAGHDGSNHQKWTSSLCMVLILPNPDIFVLFLPFGVCRSLAGCEFIFLPCCHMGSVFYWEAGGKGYGKCLEPLTQIFAFSPNSPSGIVQENIWNYRMGGLNIYSYSCCVLSLR